MATERPAQVGDYTLLQDLEAPELSVRIFRLRADAQAVEAHVHHATTQTYIALSGRVAVTCDGVETVLRPFEALRVRKGSIHGVRPVEDAVVMNISCPPLAAGDQVPVAAAVQPEDLRLPAGERADLDD